MSGHGSAPLARPANPALISRRISAPMRSPCWRLAPRRNGVPSLPRCAMRRPRTACRSSKTTCRFPWARAWAAGAGLATRCPRSTPSIGASCETFRRCSSTGSNGKTTTVRLIAAMAAAAGMTPGFCSTEGIVVGGQAEPLRRLCGPRRRAHRIARREGRGRDARDRSRRHLAPRLGAAARRAPPL